MSHPTWVRGLKSFASPVFRDSLVVAPHVGAWIEIGYGYLCTNHHRVAPHVGAWIEIQALAAIQSERNVAPHVGAWIEIVVFRAARARSLSHPTWVRGLKL